jgi:hypothetical protein
MAESWPREVEVVSGRIVGRMVGRRGKGAVSSSLAALMAVLIIAVAAVTFLMLTGYFTSIAARSGDIERMMMKSREVVKLAIGYDVVREDGQVRFPVRMQLKNAWSGTSEITYVMVLDRQGNVLYERSLDPPLTLYASETRFMKPSQLVPELAPYDGDWYRMRREIGLIILHTRLGNRFTSFYEAPGGPIIVYQGPAAANTETTTTTNPTTTTTVTETYYPPTITTTATETTTVTVGAPSTTTTTVTKTVTRVVPGPTQVDTVTVTSTYYFTPTITSTSTITQYAAQIYTYWNTITVTSTSWSTMTYWTYVWTLATVTRTAPYTCVIRIVSHQIPYAYKGYYPYWIAQTVATPATVTVTTTVTAPTTTTVTATSTTTVTNTTAIATETRTTTTTVTVTGPGARREVTRTVTVVVRPTTVTEWTTVTTTVTTPVYVVRTSTSTLVLTSTTWTVKTTTVVQGTITQWLTVCAVRTTDTLRYCDCKPSEVWHCVPACKVEYRWAYYPPAVPM